MNQDQFVVLRQAQWQELSAILDRLQKLGIRQLPAESVDQMGSLYRHAASDLAYARTYFPGSATSQYLNQLVARAHTAIYAEEPQRWKSLWRLFAAEVPSLIREARRHILLAIALTLLGAVLGFAAILADPNLADALVPAEIRQHAPQVRQGDIFAVNDRPVIGTLIMLNNIRVGVLAFGLGITLGVGTALVLIQNGLVIGALAAQYFKAGLSYPFWALIVPHGALELMAIFACGAAGFVMGWPLVSPGELTRREALRAGALRGVKVVIGSVPLFIVAAMIEGFITPMGSLPDAGKYLVGAITLMIGLAYWYLGGRPPKGALAP